MPMYTIRITYEDATQATAFYRLRHLSDFIKTHPLRGERKSVPILPWLIDMAWDKIKDDRVDGRVCRIDIEERAT